jgi:AmmeMemoRadiSam system protein A
MMYLPAPRRLRSRRDPPAIMETDQPILEETARRELLALSRATLEGYLATDRIPEWDVVHPVLRRRSGAFVSLHKGEELRGCIGMLSEDHELFRTVQRCTISAALEDSRFRPVTPEEVPELSIEISVLSPLRRVTDVGLIEVDKHGLVIALGNLRGLLLPQVATKYHWDRDTFLAQTCRKAGLPSNAWRDPKVVIQVFEAQVFSE